MTTLLRSLTVTLFAVCLSFIPAMAQSSLEKIIEPLKDGDNGSSVMYQEKRNPETRAIVESSLFVEFSDAKLANKIIDAMKKERSNATDFSSYSDKNNHSYRITFRAKNGDSSEYNLYSERNKWSLTVRNKRPSLGKSKSKSTPRRK